MKRRKRYKKERKRSEKMEVKKCTRKGGKKRQEKEGG